MAGNPDDSTSLSCYCDEDHTGPECERLSWLSRSGGSDASRCPVDDYAVVSFEMVDTHGKGFLQSGWIQPRRSIVQSYVLYVLLVEC